MDITKVVTPEQARVALYGHAGLIIQTFPSAQEAKKYMRTEMDQSDRAGVSILPLNQ